MTKVPKRRSRSRLLATRSVKMADDNDVPPLEDMTDVLKQVDALRLQKDAHKLSKDKGPAKQRAKVTKKKLPGKGVAPEDLPKDGNSSQNKESVDTTTSVIKDMPAVPPSEPLKSSVVETKTTGSSGDMFGGMKKGFLFGGPVVKPASKKPPVVSSTPVKSGMKEKKKEPGTGKVESAKVEEMPYITASGKTPAGLTLEEVQQAMDETKGLLDNQEWITDDLLGKIEGNELLLKRFADPTFMKALQEFQTNPQAAMEKYKGNMEVEKFLLEFCGILGDHFTNMGSNPPTKDQKKTSSNQNPPPAQTKQEPKVVNKDSSRTGHQTPQKDKIVELVDSQPQQQAKIIELDNPTDSRSQTNTAKIIELDNPAPNRPKQGPKIVELDPSIETANSGNININLAGTGSSNTRSSDTIRTRAGGADITEMPKVEDPDVKAMLGDDRVMETLLDPQVMGLIQTLKTDPGKAQSVVDKADPALRQKIQFLVSKGLLQFQNR